MEVTAPKVRNGSRLHWMTGITPGYAPAWFCSRNSCNGFDFLTGVTSATCIIAVPLVLIYGGWAWAVALPVIAGVIVPVERFVGRERFGRARLHRGECVWCGRPDTPPGTVCPACARRT